MAPDAASTRPRVRRVFVEEVDWVAVVGDMRNWMDQIDCVHDDVSTHVKKTTHRLRCDNHAVHTRLGDFVHDSSQSILG